MGKIKREENNTGKLKREEKKMGKYVERNSVKLQNIKRGILPNFKILLFSNTKQKRRQKK